MGRIDGTTAMRCTAALYFVWCHLSTAYNYNTAYSTVLEIRWDEGVLNSESEGIRDTAVLQ